MDEFSNDLVLQQDTVPKMNQLMNSGKKCSTSFFSLFYAADKLDYLLMFLGSVGACIHGATFPAFFVLFGRLIDSLGHLTSDPHKMSSKISQNALYLMYLGLIEFPAAWIGVAFWMQTGERQAARLRLKYLQSVLSKDMNFFDTEARDSNIIFHISSDAILVQDAIGAKIGHTIRYLAQFTLGYAVGFAYVWQLTLLTLAAVPLIATAGVVYTVIMSSLSEKSEAAYAEAGKVAEEVISQVRTVYSFVGENKAIEAYSKALKKALKFGKKCGVAKGLGVGFTYGLMFCAWALFLWYASILVRHRVTNGGNAFTIIINVILSGFALGQAAPNIAAISKGGAAAATIINLIEADSNTSKIPKDKIVLQKVNGEIQFCQVCFAYPSRPNMVFENLSFEISAGKTFAVVGPSGSGKSTIISMVQCFYEPTSGKITLDGHDFKTLQLKWLREQMGLVNQEPALFATSIAENILFGKEDATMAQIVKAAKVANAHCFIQDLPDGYHTQVGEGGTQLSSGQKQRIAIARAVVRNPKILLLDEATSALDAESELSVQQALDKIMTYRTTIIVAHRLSTIRDVHKIFVLKNGQVAESGNHSDLISKGGEYASLVNLQLSKEVASPVAVSHSEIAGNSSFQEPPNSHNHLQDLMPTSKGVIQSNDANTSQEKFAVTPSIWELVKLNTPEWPYTVLGTVGAILAGMEAPLCALGITHLLTIFYSPDASEMKHEVQRVALIFIGAAVVTIPIYLLQHYYYTMMGEGLTARVRLSMFSAIVSNEIGWFDLHENNAGSLTSALAADATLVRSALADRLSTIVQNMSLAVTAFVIAFTLCWRIASVVVASFPILILASLAEQLFLKGFGGDYAVYSRATAIAREAISNIRIIAAFGAEERISLQFASELKGPKKKELLRGHISGCCYGLTQLFAFFSYALGLWYGSILITRKESNFGHVIKSFMVLIVTAFSVAEALALTPDIVKGSQTLGSVFSIIHRKTAINPDDPTSVVVSDIKGHIEFRNVYFKYPARPDVPIFEDLNLNVPVGRSLAVVGQSGSGKSTMVSLILRFYDPLSGAILIDGYDIKALNLKSLRLKIGLVQQEPALFCTTIYENIKYGNENASEIEIVKAAKAAYAHGFISKMPEGYHTHVGDRGLQLSGGQKQRVAIARALLKNPSILLLDEATSALDTASEKVVQEALDKLMNGRTTILVAHRLSTVRNADGIAVLQRGKVVEFGTHNQLTRKSGGVYKELVNLQQENSYNYK